MVHNKRNLLIAQSIMIYAAILGKNQRNEFKQFKTLLFALFNY